MRYSIGTQAGLDSSDILALICSSDGLIATLSPEAEQLTEYPSQELIGRPITHIMADQTVFEMPDMMDSLQRTGHWNGEVLLRRRDGTCFEARATLLSLAGQENIPRGCLLLAVPAAATEPNRDETPMRDVGEVLRKISHELNNPLAVIMGFAQLILLNARCESQIRSDMEKLFSELKRVIQIVDRLHSYSITLQEHRPAEHSLLANQA